MNYTEMLAGRGMKVGDQVVCDFRLPSDNQWWIHPFWVGVIEQADETEGTAWGCKSEARACVALKDVRVRYLAGSCCAGHLQHDPIGNLRQLHFGDVSESPTFTSDATGYRALYEFACKCGFGDYYSHGLRLAVRKVA
jgi:hypothetical protein